MMMLFSSGVKGLPTEQLMPFSDEDFILMLSPSVGLRLCNLITDDGDKFKIGKIIESAPEFSCESLQARMDEFVEIRDARLERFFVTKKSPYLFFDKEEQTYLSKTSFALNLNCAVEIYTRDISGVMQKVNLDEMPFKQQRFTLSQMKRLKVREVMDVGEAAALRKAAHKDQTQKKDEVTMEDFFRKYPKLKEITTQIQFDRYRKFLLKKYHPDISKEENAATLSAQINTDFDLLITTDWYKKLRNDKGVE